MTWQGQFHVDVVETMDGVAGAVIRASVDAADRMGVGDSAYPALTTNTEGLISKIDVVFHCDTDPGLKPGDRLAIGGHFSAVTPPADVLGEGGQDFEPPAAAVPPAETPSTSSADSPAPVAEVPAAVSSADPTSAVPSPAPDSAPVVPAPTVDPASAVAGDDSTIPPAPSEPVTTNPPSSDGVADASADAGAATTEAAADTVATPDQSWPAGS